MTQKAWNVGAGWLKSGALGCCLPGMHCMPLALFPRLQRKRSCGDVQRAALDVAGKTFLRAPTGLACRVSALLSHLQVVCLFLPGWRKSGGKYWLHFTVNLAGKGLCEVIGQWNANLRGVCVCVSLALKTALKKKTCSDV